MNSDVANVDSLGGAVGAPKRISRFMKEALVRIPDAISPTRHPAASVILLSLVLICSAIAGCGREDSVKYEAEKALFNARKLRDDVFRGSIREPFLDRAIQGYRDVVTGYREKMPEVEGLAMIVVSAQMELAELEFRTGRFLDARADFDEAIDIASDVPAARANAIYSCGVISEELRDPETAISYFERFADDYLTDSELYATARMNMLYIKIPLRISRLYQTLGNEEKAASWLGKAGKIYRLIIENEENEAIRKEVSYNLLSVYLQGKEWKRAIEHIEELEKKYGEDRNSPSLVFIRAMIEKEGFGDSGGAYDIYMRVYDEYPESIEAPRALLAAADIRFNEKRYEDARKIYRKVVEEYAGSVAEAVQAEWQIARLLEASGDWNAASLKYKEIYQNYPNSEQGLRAPLKIIKYYLDKEQMDAARAAYGQAIGHYEKLVTGQNPIGVKISAESNLVTAHADLQEWEKAANLLLQLPDKYPGYPPFRLNYLRAASIYEKELGDTTRASQALRICMERYPGSPIAAEAEKQYRRLEEQR